LYYFNAEERICQENCLIILRLKLVYCRKVGGLVFVLRFLVPEQRFEVLERLICRARLSACTRLRSGIAVALQHPGMLVVVAVDTEQLPVAAVRGIVEMVVILVMYRELLELLAGELAAAMRADVRQYLEGLAAIALVPLLALVSYLRDELIHFLGVFFGG
jgi:hypothetical protein